MWRLSNWDYKSDKFHLGEERQRQWETLQNCFAASQVTISVNAEPLEPASAFPYLGHTFTFNNSDYATLQHNLRKSRHRGGAGGGGGGGEVLTRTGVAVRAQAILYKVVVQMVLLYVS